MVRLAVIFAGIGLLSIWVQRLFGGGWNLKVEHSRPQPNSA